MPKSLASAASSSAENGEVPVSLRDSVVRGMPVRVDASRSETLLLSSRSLTTPASPALMLGGCSIWGTVVPTWNERKTPRGKLLTLLGYLSAPWRYLVGVSDNTRERSAWSAAVAAQIRAERARASKTREQIAEASGVSLSTYRRLETGERVADTTQLARLCGAFGLAMSEFFRLVEQSDPEAAYPD